MKSSTPTRRPSCRRCWRSRPTGGCWPRAARTRSKSPARRGAAHPEDRIRRGLGGGAPVPRPEDPGRGDRAEHQAGLGRRDGGPALLVARAAARRGEVRRLRPSSGARPLGRRPAHGGQRLRRLRLDHRDRRQAHDGAADPAPKRLDPGRADARPLVGDLARSPGARRRGGGSHGQPLRPGRLAPAPDPFRPERVDLVLELLRRRPADRRGELRQHGARLGRRDRPVRDGPSRGTAAP